MITSNGGISLIKSMEGCRLTAYWDVNGYSIGYGHHSGVNKGDTITALEAETLLINDLEVYEREVNRASAVYNWTQNEFDALVSFAYNIGSINQLTAGNTRTKEVIAEKMLLYTKAGGKTLPALVRRRQAEHDLFLSPGIPEKETDGEEAAELAEKLKALKSAIMVVLAALEDE